jgi:hypothetical protein
MAEHIDSKGQKDFISNLIQEAELVWNAQRKPSARRVAKRGAIDAVLPPRPLFLKVLKRPHI